MKSVLISIKPKWCDLIASGKKTIEVRKNRPKIETPFKCYIYCCKPKQVLRYVERYEDGGTAFVKTPDGSHWFCSAVYSGKVIGEFVCSHIDRMAHCGTSDKDIRIKIVDNFGYKEIEYEYLQNCQLAYNDLEMYSNGGDIYAWHISDLKIYNKPYDKQKELNEFGLSRPPQSWCYVRRNVQK